LHINTRPSSDSDGYDTVRPTAWVSRAARPSLTQPPAPKSTTASAAPLAAVEGGVGFTRC